MIVVVAGHDNKNNNVYSYFDNVDREKIPTITVCCLFKFKAGWNVTILYL